MGRDTWRFAQHEREREAKRKMHPIWRGVGCVLLVALAFAGFAAAGWFTLPNESQPFPKGTGPTSRLADLHFDLDGLLRIPTLVVASRNDTDRDPALRRRKQLDKTQGRNRLERAQRWVRAMRRAARARGIEPVYRFRSLAHSDHDFVTAVRRDNLDELIFNYLFDTSSQNQPETMT